MSDFLHDPPRWKDRADQARLAERSAGQMVRTMGQTEPLSGAQLARIAARVRSRRSRPRRLRLWAPVTAVLFFGGVAAASAAHIDILPRWLIDIVRPGTVVPRSPAPAPRSLRVRPKAALPAPAPALIPVPALAEQAAAPQVEPAPAVELSPSVLPMVPPQPARPTRTSPSERAREPIRKLTTKTGEAKPPQATMARLPTPLPPVQPAAAAQVVSSPDQPAAAADPVPATDLPSHTIAPVTTTMKLAWVNQHIDDKRAEPVRMLPEARQAAPAGAEPGAGPLKHLSAAVHALRAEHSPTAALALLDRYGDELDKSSVSHEALLLRVEAMLKLERRAEVLNLLDATPLAGVAASRTLLLTRGELRASASRCAEALTDFELVLVQTQGRNKRALVGRARCQKGGADTD